MYYPWALQVFMKVWRCALLSFCLQGKCTLSKDISHTGSRYNAFFLAQGSLIVLIQPTMQMLTVRNSRIARSMQALWAVTEKRDTEEYHF